MRVAGAYLTRYAQMDGVEEKLPFGLRKGRGEMYKGNYQFFAGR